MITLEEYKFIFCNDPKKDLTVVSGKVLVYLYVLNGNRPTINQLLETMEAGDSIPGINEVVLNPDKEPVKVLLKLKTEEGAVLEEKEHSSEVSARFLKFLDIKTDEDLTPEEALIEAITKRTLDRFHESSETIRRNKIKNREKRQKSYETLAGVFASKKEKIKRLLPDTPNLLYNALTAVCIKEKMPTAGYDELCAICGDDLTPQDYARSAGFICREVTLPKNWRKEDLGPMLFLIGEEERPLAYFRSMGKNKYWDPATKEVRSLKELKVQEKEIKAYSLIKPLPSGKITWKQMVGHSLHTFRVFDLVTLIIATLLAAFASMFNATITNMIYGQVIPNGNITMLIAIGWFAVTFMIASVIFSVGKSLTSFRMTSKVRYALQGSLYDRLFHMEESYFRGKESAQIAYRTDNLANSYCGIFSAVVDIAMMIVSTAMYLAKMSSYSPDLTAMTGIFVGFSVAATVGIGYFVQKNQMKCSRLNSEIRSFLYQTFGGITTIRATGAADAFQNRYLDYYTRYSKLYNKRCSQSRLSAFVVTGLSAAAIVVAYRIMGGRSLGIDTGTFLAFLSASAAFTGAMTAIASDVLLIFIMYPMLKDGSEILNATTEQNRKGIVLQDYSGEVKMSNVTFRYKGPKNEMMPPVLKGINLHIRPGEYVGIVGTSGCGKSTLLRLILGFEIPESGSVSFDRIRSDKLDRVAFRRNIGTVLQDGVLFSGSIYKNICISKPDATSEEVMRAADLACISEDIKKMPLGFATPVSEESETISGGQKQRIMLARAILGNPKLLLLDEATSALDNVNQATIIENLNKLNCTRITVAHRLSTVQNCDRILVMDEGKITEEGTFEELMEKKGSFYELAKTQIL